MPKTTIPEPQTGVDHPLFEGPPPTCTIVEYITLVRLIKLEVHEPRPSLVANYNSIVEIRDLIAAFEKVG
ncbi:unnamed protein product [marine sediment metagenome]|uniref:Uncharacterized protein n=1 Tax=marine sediment metagenome TaxID=412755 RepID=X1GW17_9ZZZZ